MTSPRHARTVDSWTATNAAYTDGAAPTAWAQDEITWGILRYPEAEIGVLPDVRGFDVVELGCGTAYFSAWLARRGARVVGVDPTPAQLETARRMQAQFGPDFPLVEASGEDVPLPDVSFDLALSEYGASLWAEPERWLSEAARLLRPGGQLVFMRFTTLAMLCLPVDDEDAPVDERLHRPQSSMHRFEHADGSVEFHVPTGELIDLLGGAGFGVERLVELHAPESAQRHPEYDHILPGWARRWPAEEIWVARKRDGRR